MPLEARSARHQSAQAASSSTQVLGIDAVGEDEEVEVLRRRRCARATRVDRAQAGEDAVDRLVADRHDDRRARRGVERLRRQLLAARDREAIARRAASRRSRTAPSRSRSRSSRRARRRRRRWRPRAGVRLGRQRGMKGRSGDDARHHHEKREQGPAPASAPAPRDARAASLLARRIRRLRAGDGPPPATPLRETAAAGSAPTSSRRAGAVVWA